MDADFSHHPRYLHTMLTRLDSAEFVTGSRYVEGGRCDYGLRRQLISRAANAIARIVLGLGLAENTTLYRGFTRSLLSRLDIDRIRSDGYSFAVESLYEVSRVTRNLAEFPIHFEDRVAGDSKISKSEIFKAILTLLRLGFIRLNPFERKNAPGPTVRPTKATICMGCGSPYQIEKYPARLAEAGGSKRAHGWRSAPARDSAAYSCASHDSRTYGRILQCLHCGLVFMEPGVEERELVEAYTDSRDEGYLHNLEARVRTFDYNFSRVLDYVPGNARMLDVGSHCGAFLRVADGYGLDIMGVEPSAWAVEAASDVTNRPVVHGTLGDLPADTEPFDVVTLWDVLEHLYDPKAELRQIHDMLEPSGILMLSTIMIDNWFPRMMGREWPWLMDMHLFYFSEGSLADMLDRAGFEILESRNYRHIVTFEYLLEKVASLGVPGMKAVAGLVGRTPLGRSLLPFRFGDIKLFVCRKTNRADLEPRTT
jgi:SAM-dependent methyltransferase